jgi:hypothetical protein
VDNFHGAFFLLLAGQRWLRNKSLFLEPSG